MEEESLSIDVEADRRFQEGFWIAVRIGWMVMAGVLLAAIMGFTGSGGSYSAQRLSAGEATIKIPAVSRWATSDTMTITVRAPIERTTVLVPAGFGDVFSLESINPQPQSVSAGPDGDEFVFELRPGGKTSIEFSLRASRPVWSQKLSPFRVNGQESEGSEVTILP
ncbi:MAG: hypothetical protein COW16_06825 [Sphingomonadales bacterium CG12_big_fil_rev_8_21_14_0_65_65_10]|nr:MAG: hypothetical protein COW16_06825 [Sphingomonadales bacterium CG12_big_fil_rev_8_21_14_0_65_65_10]